MGIIDCSKYDYLQQSTLKESNFHDFAWALKMLKDERRVTRTIWNGSWLHLQKPNSHSYMTKPYIYIECPPGKSKLYPEGYRVSWTPNQLDLLAEDWYEVGYEG